MASSLMVSQTLTIRNPINFLSHHHSTTALYLPSAHNRHLLAHSKPQVFSFPAKPNPSKSRISVSVSASLRIPVIESSRDQNPSQDLLSGSTRTVTTLLATALTASKFLAGGILGLAVQLKAPLVYKAGPAFFAAMKDVPTGSLNTPFTVVAAGMAKWLDIYSGVLMVRVLLSWFPNIPWDRQPLSAIRDLCDPYLNLFRNIIPPIFDTLDVSPLLAFAVLGTLGSILNSSRGAY
ncbi:ylmG homolog protein 1-2, chloroplastic-like [Olea europaea var. sylvestris]|uniref:YlmG homolog 1-2, chloroplastic-like n=1 Tax=Olea europaea subsp. europaea TaxID=158383 RepID=A0A8S0QCE6_OLEEU|nr:ylmG homolog protein 1-2, chloroplastic-like [Olea europaea var. sylvestris]CAA2965085.1 ylmG homolog 1-2, chloroplastic-like [Olea europaea subsp. europaea]